MTSALIFGCGYLGERVASLWSGAGAAVHVVSRSKSRAARLREAGYEVVVADVVDPATLVDLPPTDVVLFAVGYDRAGVATINAVYADGVRNVLAALPEAAGRFLYISSTGVYGDANGRWVDEQTPPDPQRAGGRASLAAERRLAANPPRRSAILRLAGIYGPGRVPYLDKLRAGQPIPAPHEGWLNLIHVVDAAGIVVAVDRWLAQQFEASHPHVFNVCDGAPVVRGDYYREAARRIGAPPPQFAEPDADSPAAARASSDRRVSNEKLVRFVRPRLEFRSYREGLAAVLM